MARQNILVIEDDEDIFELVQYNLTKNGYAVTGAFSGEDGLSSIERNIPDLVLLDLMLPGIDGFSVCKTIKSDPDIQSLPIIMLTAKGEDRDIVTGFELGADDYVTKPFSPSVLIARVKSVLRRQDKSGLESSVIINIENMCINLGKHEVTINGLPLELTTSEFKVLSLLANKRGWAFSRYQIVGVIKGDDYSVTDRAIDVIIVGLRKKLGEYGSYIETVRGVGYRFKE